MTRRAAVLLPLALTALVLALAGGGRSALVPWFGTVAFGAPSLVVVGSGLLAGLSWSAWTLTWWRSDPRDAAVAASGIVGFAVLATAVLLFAAVARGMAPANAAIALPLATVSLMAAHRLVEALARGESIGWRSYWGGLGGGGGGFALLPATALAFVAVGFTGAAVAVALGAGPTAAQGPQPTPSLTSAARPAPSQTASPVLSATRIPQPSASATTTPTGPEEATISPGTAR